MILTVLWLVSSAGTAQRYYIDSYEQGAVFQGRVNDIAADSVGFIWIATDEGLYRFDGLTPTLIKKGRYTALLQTAHGDLLVENADGIEMLRYKGEAPQFNKSSIPGLKDYNIRLSTVVEVKNGRFWALADDGILQFDMQNSQKYAFPGPEASSGDFQLTADTDGQIWLAEGGVIYRLNSENHEFIKVAEMRHYGKVIAMASLSKHTLLVKTKEGLYSVKVDDAGRLIRINKLEEAPEGITRLAVTDEGTIFLGTRGSGLYFGRYYNGSFTFEKVFNSNDPHRIQELSFSSVHCIYAHSPSEIWVGHEHGITLLRELTFANVSLYLPHATVVRVTKLDNGDTYATIEGVMYKIHGNRHPYQIESIDLGLKEYRPGVIQGVGNRLWITTSGFQLFYIENGKKSPVLDLSDRGSALFAIRNDNAGNIWAVQAPRNKPLVGLLKITPDLQVKEYNKSDGFQSRMLIVEQAPYGVIYAAGIGEKSYLYRYDPVQDKFENISPPMDFNYGDNFEVHDIAITADSTIWMASTAGLLHYKNGKTEHIYIDEFKDNEAVAVELTNDDAVWFYTDSKGIVRYKDGEYVVYNQKMGLPANFMTYRALFIDKTDRIWAGTREGLCVSLRHTPEPLQVRKPQFLTLDTNGHPLLTKKKDVIATRGTLEASFISLTYPLDKISYQYRLLGLRDSTWSNESSDNSIRIADLPSGEYTLQVKAKQVAGYIESDPLTFHFRVDKVWYAKWWGILLLAMGGLLALTVVFYAGYTVRMRALKKQKLALQKLVDERTRALSRSNEALEQQKQELRVAAEQLKQKNSELDQFAYIVSHDLKAPLRAIHHLSQWIEEDLEGNNAADVEKNMKLMRSRVRRMENLIDGILSYARIGKVEMENAEVNLNQLLDETIDMLDIPAKFKVVIPEKLPVVCTNSTSLEQIFSNLISNAAKYHDKPEGTITIEYKDEGDQYTFSVADDGPGIPEEFHEKAFVIFQTLQPKDSGESTGVGLAIVKKIVTEHKGRIWVESERGKGTTFWFTLPKCQERPDEK